MEFVEGGDLASLIKSFGCLPVEMARYMRQEPRLLGVWQWIAAVQCVYALTHFEVSIKFVFYCVMCIAAAFVCFCHGSKLMATAHLRSFLLSCMFLLECILLRRYWL